MFTYWLDRWARIAAAVMVAAFFGVGIWVIVPFRQIPTQTAPLVKSWAAAAPSKGKIDALAQKATDAIPTAQEKQNLLKAATGVVSAAGGVVTTAGEAIKTTSANLNRPCSGPKGPDACGTLAQTNKVIIRISDEITQTQLEQRGVFPHVTAAMDTFKNAADGLNGGISDLRGFYAKNQQNVAQLLANSVDITGTGGHMLKTADEVETKATHSYLHPSHNPFVRTWNVANPFLVAGAKIAATTF